jgi:hypothetical protein
MADPKILLDLEIDVNENCGRRIDPVLLGGINEEIEISND